MADRTGRKPLVAEPVNQKSRHYRILIAAINNQDPELLVEQMSDLIAGNKTELK